MIAACDAEGRWPEGQWHRFIREYMGTSLDLWAARRRDGQYRLPHEACSSTPHVQRRIPPRETITISLPPTKHTVQDKSRMPGRAIPSHWYATQTGSSLNSELEPFRIEGRSIFVLLCGLKGTWEQSCVRLTAPDLIRKGETVAVQSKAAEFPAFHIFMIVRLGQPWHQSTMSSSLKSISTR